MLKSIASLYLLQLLSYFVPLFLTPYLARTLGVEIFGVSAICVSVVAYVSLLSNWGFDLSASQQVAHAADSPTRLRALFWDTLTARIGLGLVGYAILIAVVVISPTLRDHWPIMLATSLALLASMFSANWFLQGLERMGSYATATLFGRLLSIPATFLFVHSPRDGAMAAGIQAGAACISAIGSIWACSRTTNLGPPTFNPTGAIEQVREGARLFLSTAAISLYTYMNLLAVGFLAGPAQAGLFDGADRMKRATQALTGPISNAAYPRINRMMVQSRHRVSATMLRLLIVQGGLSLVLAAGVFVLAPWATPLLLGRAYAASVPIAQWLSINIFWIGVSNVLGINIMLPLGMKRPFTLIIIGSGAINIGLLAMLVRPFGALGAAQAVTITEGVVTVAMAVWLVVHRAELAGSSSSLVEAEPLVPLE